MEGAAAAGTCPDCGAKGQKGKFCADCGAKMPAMKGAADGRAACGCDKQTERSAAQGDDKMSKKEDLVKRLLASGKSPFTEADAKTLEAFSDERLEAMVRHCEGVPAPAPAPAPVAAPAPATKDDVGPKPTEEEQIAALPATARAMVARYQAMERDERAALVKSLVAAQNVKSAEQLAAMPTEELSALAKMLKVDEPKHDFTGRQAASATDVVVPEAPKPWTLALEAAAAKPAN